VRKTILQDWERNRHNPKGQFVLAAFRLAQMARAPLDAPPRTWVKPYLIAYKIIVEWILGVELQWGAQIGPRLKLLHGYGLVVSRDCVIGADCTLRHGVTLGNRGDASGGQPDSPVLGSHVDVGAHAQIIGRIQIGSGSVIGAGSVVTRDVPKGVVVAGNPARVIGQA
jgi:putative colanic acid biosynthesis acetyltransferase WcaB